jgi:hypothetical protein
MHGMWHSGMWLNEFRSPPEFDCRDRLVAPPDILVEKPFLDSALGLSASIGSRFAITGHQERWDASSVLVYASPARERQEINVFGFVFALSRSKEKSGKAC